MHGAYGGSLKCSSRADLSVKTLRASFRRLDMLDRKLDKRPGTGRLIAPTRVIGDAGNASAIYDLSSVDYLTEYQEVA